MIQSVLISGELDEARLARALGELADLGSAPVSARNPVIVIDSDGGYVSALGGFLECVFADQRTRSLVERARVKIYNAQSAAAIIALSFGGYREMAAGTSLGFHLPLLTLNIGDADRDDRIAPRILESSQESELCLEQLMDRYGLNEPMLKSELYRSGWLRLTADECLRRGFVQALFD
jgi:hypothetical protein